MKPITITKQGRTYTIAVKSPKLSGAVTQTDSGKLDVVEGAAPHKFASYADAEHIAHKIGRYKLGLGDMVFSYVTREG